MTVIRDATDGSLALISRLYPGLYNRPPPQHPRETKPRRRRKRKAGNHGGITGMKKRKLSQEQVNLLEQKFGDEHKLESERKGQLAAELGLDPRQVAVWFQNRRARYKSKKLEEEYSRLKSTHETVVAEKSRLENEVIKLKERLAEAEKESRRALGLLDGLGSSNSPSSSVTVNGAMGQLATSWWTRDYVYEDVLFPETGCIMINGMDWGF
ncbi:hypothetical protein MLD38_028908 [Melastoma candidum]|uniref:Uncharacterized protein n=1 Tax=Melastoma candidum TaxID=119954 RepID=A0ACB9N2H2_9MYRT|nr:hypothetical protein MLD38_028908 [Melastoma candidum]